MTDTSTNQDLPFNPPTNEPMYRNGYLTPAWRVWLQTLWSRTGGGSGSVINNITNNSTLGGGGDSGNFQQSVELTSIIASALASNTAMLMQYVDDSHATPANVNQGPNNYVANRSMGM